MNAWLRFWKAFDLARIFPRGIMLGCGYLTYQTHLWFTALPEPSTAQSLYVSVVYGVIPLLLNFYMQNGTPWAAPQAPAASVTTATATVTTDKP